VAADRVPVAFGEAPEGGTELEGVNWYLTEMTTGQITARFQDGRVSGSAGCNNYFGSYILTPGSDALEIGELATTRMMCEEAVMEQESAFLQALSATTAYSVDDDLLTLTYPDGTLLFSGQ
jgi:heat shock protein HslJ